MLNDKKILIIGGTGTWGTALLEKLLETDAAQIKVLARNEHNLVSLRQHFKDNRVIPVLGDIRDKNSLMFACQDVDILFHLAALKHVPVCEELPTEAILTNVAGTQHVIECANACHVEKVVYTSTDKAVSPHCTYGCTKLLGEKLILSANTKTSATNFIVFRSGNLLGSSGSVVPLFRWQIETEGCVRLTDERMSRFFIPISQAAELLIESAVRGTGGEVFLPRMNALSIRDIAKYLLEKSGLDESHIRVTGIRPGEALSETMATEEESKSLCLVSGALCAIVEQGAPLHAANAYANYQVHSANAALPWEQARAFLSAANI